MGEMMQIGFPEGMKTVRVTLDFETYFYSKFPNQGKLDVWHHRNPIACRFQVHEDISFCDGLGLCPHM